MYPTGSYIFEMDEKKNILKEKVVNLTLSWFLQTSNAYNKKKNVYKDFCEI